MKRRSFWCVFGLIVSMAVFAVFPSLSLHYPAPPPISDLAYKFEKYEHWTQAREKRPWLNPARSARRL